VPEQAVPATDSDDDPLHRPALDVEQQAHLNAEMDQWEAATLKDGIPELPRRRIDLDANSPQ